MTPYAETGQATVSLPPDCGAALAHDDLGARIAAAAATATRERHLGARIAAAPAAAASERGAAAAARLGAGEDNVVPGIAA